MTKFINPGLMQTSRRNVLRGSVLASAAAMTGTAAFAGARRGPAPRAHAPTAQIFNAAETRLRPLICLDTPV